MEEKAKDRMEFGKRAEEEACAYLEGFGWRVLERRARFREGEIDLIMVGVRELLFVEVKGRRSGEFGDVVEALTSEKIRRLKKAIAKWRKEKGDRRPGRLLFIGVFENEVGEFTMKTYFIE